MAELALDTVHTVSIDETGELARFQVSGDWDTEMAIGLNISSDTDGVTASYAVDLGGSNVGDGEPTWVAEDEATYTGVESVSDGWYQTEEWLRVRVTDAAAAGEEATLYVSRGV